MPNDAGREQRRLAAILAADVVGYSRLIADDESGTLARLRAHRSELIDPAIAKVRGRVFKTNGDGLLAEFPSVVDAVACAGEIQSRMDKRNSELPPDRRLLFRIGVSIGDVVAEGDDLHGDGVNQAARLEALADPGGLCISGDARAQLKGRSSIAFEDIGLRKAKPHDTPLHVFRARLGVAVARRVSPSRRLVVMAATAVIALLAVAGVRYAVDAPLRPWLTGTFVRDAARDSPDERQSIAVLPFANLSNDPEQAFFADGMSEDILTALTRLSGLKVIARNSSFRYKGQNVDIRQIGRELGVRYVLDGSVRRDGDRLRITAQLTDTTDGKQLWADKYDRPKTDVFAVQEELTNRIAVALGRQIVRAETALLLAASPEKFDAYELTLIGRELRGRGGREDAFLARQYLEKAIKLDPSYSLAYVILTQAYEIFFGRNYDTGEFGSPEMRERIVATAARAVELDPKSSFAHATYALQLILVRREDEAMDQAELAFTLGPNDYETLLALATFFTRWGDQPKALELHRRALAVDRFPRPLTLGVNGRVLYLNGNYKEAVTVLRRCASESRETPSCAEGLLAALGQIGTPTEKKEALNEYQRLSPTATVSSVRLVMSARQRRKEDLDHYLDGLRKAGLPE